MPTPHAPASLIFQNADLTPAARAVVTFALQPVEAPPGLPQGHCVLAILEKAAHTLAATFLSMTDEAAGLLAHIGSAAAAVPECAGSVLGSKAAHEIWSVLSELRIDQLSPEMLLLIGSEYLLAMADGRLMRRSRAQVFRVASRAIEMRDVAAVQRVFRAAQAAVERAAKRFDRGLIEKDSERRRLLSVRLHLQWSRHVQFSSRRDIKLVPSGKDLHDDEVTLCADAIRTGVQDGNIEAVIVGLAFWVGLAIEDFLDVSIAGEASEAFSIDRFSATSRADLSQALSTLAKPDYPGCVDSRLVLIRSLPLLLNSAWVEACSEMPSARCVRDLLRGHALKATDSVPGVPGEHRERLTIARFIAARSRPLIEPVAATTVVAFATLDLRRVQPSTYPYATVSAEALWDACERRSLLLGWGPISPLGCQHAIGSRVTPREEQVTAVFQWLVDALEAHYPGRHCKLSRLVKFHNLYAKYVAAFLSFVAGFRDGHPIPLLASMLGSTQVRSYKDKDVTSKASPWLILCPQAREMIRLWLAHCSSMNARLKRIAQAGKAPEGMAEVVAHIDRLQRQESVHLIFRISRGGVTPIRSRDWIRLLPKSLLVKADFGRHYWFDALLPAGASVSDAHSFLRHLAQEHEIFLSTSSKSIAGWESRVAGAIQRVVERLGIRAAQGLAKR